MEDHKVKQDAGQAAVSEALPPEPDFAFPQKVEQNAAEIYARALKEGQPVTALRAAIELNIADNLITPDSVVTALERYRYLARELPAPYSALADLLEARLLLDIYSSDSYVFDSRTLPEDSREENPLLWDGAQFKHRINALMEKVWRQRDELARTPISAIAPLLTNADEAENAHMTAFDFATYRLVELTRGLRQWNEEQTVMAAIPFEDDNTAPPATTEKEKQFTPLRLIDSLIEFETEYGDLRSEALLRARLEKFSLLSGPVKNEYAGQLLEIYGPANKWRPLIVNEVVDNLYSDSGNPGKAEDARLELLGNTIKEFPDSPYTPCLKNKVDVITRPFVSISIPEQAIPDRPTTGKYEIRNLDDCYILLIPVNPPPINGSFEQRQLSPKGEIKVIAHLTRGDAQPRIRSGEIEIPGLSPGYYAVIPSASQKLAGRFDAFKRYTVPVLNVCGFDIFVSDGSTGDTDKKRTQQTVYVSNASTGEPVKGAAFECTNIDRSSYSSSGRTVTGVTDKDGSFSCPFEDYDCRVTYKGSRMATRIWNNRRQYRDDAKYSASILTDLALYHPGDTINLVAVVSERTSNILSPSADIPVVMELMDANFNSVSKAEATTDKYGRATMKFDIPSDRITGTYHLTLSSRLNESGHDYRIATTSVEVAEYKAPAFRVLLDKPVVADETLEITGSVLTYSGMPLSDVNAAVNINFNIPWWRMNGYSNLPDNYHTEATTDQSGRFSVKLGIAKLLGTPYDAGTFRVGVTATSDTGETETSNNQWFTLSPGFHIESGEVRTEVTQDTVTIPVKVVDVIGNPVVKELSYEVLDDNKSVVTSGKFLSPALKLPSSLLKSGKYSLRTILPEAMK
ncbi:MAG: hypothetical protein K2F87_04270 [Muribaculaceae bacterium]|nr:hypothetical protein [Muribaculaceae bacterium]